MSFSNMEEKMIQKNSKPVSKNLSVDFKPVFFGEFEINAKTIPIENIEDGFASTITKILAKAEREVGKEFSDYYDARIFAMNGKLMGRYTTRIYKVLEEEMPEICQKLKKFNLFPANR